MIAKILIQILVSVKLKWKAENCPSRFCKIYISYQHKLCLRKKKAWIQVIFLELWLLRASIVLLPVSTNLFFYLFNCLFITY